MAENVEVNTAECSDCKLGNILIPSAHWCSVCEEALCSDCTDRHKLRKLTRGHTTIPIERYRKLPKSILNIRQYCQEHGERFQMFCKVHNCPICSICIKTHGTCTNNIVPLNDIIENAKTSEAFNDVMARLTDLGENIKKIQKDKKNNLTSIKEQTKKWEEEIRSIRQQIMEHIDRIQTQLLSELSSTEDKITHNINDILDGLKENERQVIECKTTMQDMKQFASDLQAFFGVADIEHTLTKQERFVEKMMDDKTLENINIETVIDAKVKDILDEVKIFGSVRTSTTERLNIVRRKDKQAQFVADKVRHINEINLKRIQTVLKVYHDFFIRGVDIVPNGDILATCHYRGRLVLLSDDGTIKFCHPLGNGDYAFDVKCLNDKTVVYTSGMSGRARISIFDITNRKILKTINLTGPPYGLAITEESIIVAVKGLGLQSVDRSNFHTSTILSKDLKNQTYVAACDGHFYYTDPDVSNKVTYCDMNGHIIWEFEDKSVLDYPNGVVVDNNRNVYVAGERSKNVVVIAPNGVQFKQILTARDGLARPTGLCFDRHRKRLLVADLERGVYLYDII